MTRVQLAPNAVTFEGLAGVALPMTIVGASGPVDLEQLAREVLDCVVGDHDVRSVQTVPGAIAAAADVVRSKIRRPFLPSEEAALVSATRAEVVRRWKTKREGMLDTERRLHAPFGSGLRQRIG